MFGSYLKQFKTNKPEIKKLAKDFISEKISAAGVSYVLSERSRRRRHLWLIAVIGCTIFMGYMTIKVITEYLSYPKMLMKEDIIMPKLPFPAVTVCSLNPILERFALETSLMKHLQLRKLLDRANPLPPRLQLKSDCIEEPLCQWSWFLESCVCVDNPCQTEFCLPSNGSHCLCSSTICRQKRLSCFYLPGAPLSWSRNVCLCDAVAVHEPTVHQNEVVDLEDVISKIEDDSVKDIIRLVWNSKSFDLSDVEEGLMPNIDEIYDYGINFDSLVASCSYEMDQCHRDNFTVIYHPKYGKCYMFNYVGPNSQYQRNPLMTHNYGSNSGLMLLLRVTDEEALDLVRREVGARVIVHDPHQLPFVAEYGVNLRPLDMTAVDVSMSTMTRLPAPWGECVSGKTLGITREPYTILGCEKQCNLNYMTKKCKCAIRHLLHASVLSEKTTRYPLCDFSDLKQRNCVERVLEELERKTVDCRCKAPCNETIYSYAVTSSELNGNYYKTVKAIRTLALSANGTLTYINATDQKSMIGLKVYYNTFQVSRQQEVSSYSWETLIANVGGNLGFFMGLTLITFLEIAEFLWDVIYTGLKPPEENKVYVVPSGSRRVFSRTFHKEEESTIPRRKSL